MPHLEHPWKALPDRGGRMEEKKKKANTTTTTLLPHNGAGGQSQIINITTCIIYEMKIFLCKHVETCF